MQVRDLGGLLCVMLALPLQAAEVDDWLNRMVEAERQQSFQGAFVYERNGSFSSHKMWRHVDESGAVHERLLQLDGPLQEVVSIDGQPQCVSGGLLDQLGHGYSWPVRQLDVGRLNEGYTIRLAGYSRIAGRSAVVLVFTPLDQHRYRFELHLDQQSALPLKALLVGEKGALLERLQYTDLQLMLPHERDLRANGQCRTVAHEPAMPVSVEQWQVTWMPAGFTQVLARIYPSEKADVSVETLAFDDGLASFSVFFEPLKGASAPDLRKQFGPTMVVARRVATEAGDVMVTVVGEIPLGTAERVALSVRYRGDDA